MSEATIESSNLPAPVAAKLRSLRRSVSAWLWVHGLARLLAAIVALVLLDLLIDWYFRMDWSQRAICLALMAAALAFVAFRFLARPLARRLSDDALCLRVEERHKQLGESLINAVQFSRHNPADAAAHGISPTLVRSTIEHGTRAAAGLDFAAVLDQVLLRRNRRLVLAMLAALAVLAISIALTGPMWIWFERNVLLGNLQWPQSTRLTIRNVENSTLLLPKGDDWQQMVEVEGVVPPLVYLDYEPRGWTSRVTEPMVQEGDNSFHTTFKNVLEEFRFRVRGGDAESAWISVKLIDRPAVEDLVLRVTAPAYAGASVETLPPGNGPYLVLKGSRLDIEGTATKNLSQVRIGGDKNHPGTIERDGRRFTASIGSNDLVGQTYGIELTDTDKWASKRPLRFSIKIKPDREPTVKARLDGVSGIIVPGARVPLACTLSDDFAVTDAALVYQWRADGADQPGASGRLPFEEIKGQFGSNKIACRFALETRPLDLPIGSTLSCRVEALDNDSVSGPKTGKSNDFVLKIVSEEELRGELLRREKEQRVEVERLLKDQEDFLTDSRAILATVQGQPELPEDQRQLLVKVQKRQGLASDRANRVAIELEQIIAEVQNNRLEEESGPVERRLRSHIIEPLRGVATGAIPKAAGLLDTARRSTADVSARDAALLAAAAEQQQAAVTLREVLKYMVKSEGYQEAINLLYVILKSQNELNDGTAKESQRRIREIFDGDDAKQGTETKGAAETPPPKKRPANTK